jgi:hypothetical protein
MGTAILSVDSEIKVDKKKKAGKDGATVTRQGIKDGPVTIDLDVKATFWPELSAVLDGIDPRGPSVGGPFLVTCPNLPTGFGGLQITKIKRGTAATDGGRFKIQISGTECTFPRKGSGGVGGKKKLSATEIAAAQAQIAALQTARQLAATTAAFVPVGNGAVYGELLKKIAGYDKQIASLQHQIDSSAAQAPAPSATSTPSGPGQAYSGTKGPSTPKPGAASYSSTNPQAPTGAP